MLVTEEDAKTKWCPFGRAIENGSPCPTSFNRIQTRQGEVSLAVASLCIASACMAWRTVRSGTVNNPTRMPNTGFGMKVVGGYCGLAGKPD